MGLTGPGWTRRTQEYVIYGTITEKVHRAVEEDGSILTKKRITRYELLTILVRGKDTDGNGLEKKIRTARRKPKAIRKIDDPYDPLSIRYGKYISEYIPQIGDFVRVRIDFQKIENNFGPQINPPFSDVGRRKFDYATNYGHHHGYLPEIMEWYRLEDIKCLKAGTSKSC